MPLYIVGKCREVAFEVVAYDSAAHTAVLRNDTGTYQDHNFHLGMIKRMYNLTDLKPVYLKGAHDAE